MWRADTEQVDDTKCWEQISTTVKHAGQDVNEARPDEDLLRE